MSRDLSRGWLNFSTNSITSFTYDQNQIDFISYQRHPVEPNIQATEYIVTPEVVFFLSDDKFRLGKFERCS